MIINYPLELAKEAADHIEDKLDMVQALLEKKIADIIGLLKPSR